MSTSEAQQLSGGLKLFPVLQLRFSAENTSARSRIERQPRASAPTRPLLCRAASRPLPITVDLSHADRYIRRSSAESLPRLFELGARSTFVSCLLG
jgi:hypothetical protein